ncbi:unnamed protein product, partial [Durusdinium trenchii]
QRNLTGCTAKTKARGLLTEWPDALPQRRDKRTTAWKEEDMKAGREHYDRLAEAAADRLLAQLPSPSSEDLKEPSEVAAETEPEAEACAPPKNKEKRRTQKPLLSGTIFRPRRQPRVSPWPSGHGPAAKTRRKSAPLRHGPARE